MPASETILFRCGAGACHARLDVIIPRSRGVSIALVRQRAEMVCWALAVVAVQHSPARSVAWVSAGGVGGETTLAIDLRCPACAASDPALTSAPPEA